MSTAAPKPVKKKLTKSGRWHKRQERAKKGLALLPSLLTLGNAICGIAAIIKVAKIQVMPMLVDRPERFDLWTNFRDAALLILLGMVFDVLDGRVARLTKTTSDFGGQLDSLADAITFGVAPGVLVIMANGESRFPEYSFWTKVAWTFGIAYSCGAISRLARFNVETEDHSEKAHLEFKGLPSPAAAGVIATLILLQTYLMGERAAHSLPVDHDLVQKVGFGITFILPFVALALGCLMVSRFRYVHMANRFLKGRKPFDYLALVLMAGVLLSLVPEVVLALSFVGYAITGPVLAWRKQGTETPAAGTGTADPATPLLGLAPTTTDGDVDPVTGSSATASNAGTTSAPGGSPPSAPKDAA